MTLQPDFAELADTEQAIKEIWWDHFESLGEVRVRELALINDPNDELTPPLFKNVGSVQ